MSNFSRIDSDKILVDVKFHWSKEEYKNLENKRKIYHKRDYCKVKIISNDEESFKIIERNRM